MTINAGGTYNWNTPVNITGTAFAGDVIINYTARADLNLPSSLDITGNLTVYAPNATVNNSAKVSETITITDVKSGTWNELVSGNTLVFEAENKTLHIPEDITVKSLTINKNATVITSKTVQATVAQSVTVTVKANAADETGIEVEGDGNEATLDPTPTPEPNPTIVSVTDVNDVEVEYETTLEDAIAKLAKTTTIIDSSDTTHTVNLSWTIAEYNASIAGTYTATGIFELPEGVEQTDPAMDLKVTATVTVKEAPEPNPITFGTIETFIAADETTGYTRPRVLHDGTDYHLWYRTYGGTEKVTYHRKAATIEGLKDAAQEVIAIDNTDQGSDNFLDNFFVIYENNTYYLFSSDDTNINVYTSTDGINWGFKKIVFSKGSSEAWDSLKIDNPMVTYDGTEYKLYYQGKSSSSGYQIGLATSSTIDGSTYTADDNNPILKPGDGWDSGKLYQPWVIKDGDFYYMWYAAGNGPEAIGYAWSTDGISWTKTGEAIATAPSGYYGTPSVIKLSDGWHMWFLHESSGSSSIMYVTGN